MQQTGDSKINNKERRTHLAALISPSVHANSGRHHLLVQSLTVPINQRAILDSIAKLFSRSGSRLTYEEISPWTSLMAREYPLGPSDAPCLGETSTAHGDSLFSVTLLENKTVTASESSASAPDHVPNRLPLNLLRPEPITSPQISSITQIGRRTHTERWPDKSKLGFWLKGLFSLVGPLLLHRPKPISSDPCFYAKRPRSVIQCFLSICRLSLGRFLILNGRRHHLREKSLYLLWFVNHIMKTLDLVLYMAKYYKSKSLKVHSLRCLIPSCWRDICGYRSSMPNCSSTVILAKNFQQRFNLMCFALLSALDIFSSDFGIVVKRSSTVALLFLQSLLPMRSTSLTPSSTSLCLLTVTIPPSIDSFMEARSTNRDLTCIQMLFSFGLKALMEPSSIFFNYPLMALCNALICNALNFGIFATHFSLNLNFI